MWRTSHTWPPQSTCSACSTRCPALQSEWLCMQHTGLGIPQYHVSPEPCATVCLNPCEYNLWQCRQLHEQVDMPHEQVVPHILLLHRRLCM
jgi:hypothetical protein